jgi:N-terminal domain of ribose phosphate pyrophosphokinase
MCSWYKAAALGLRTLLLEMTEDPANGIQNRVNDNIMELLIMISACKGGSANKITGSIPKLSFLLVWANRHSCDAIFPILQAEQEEIPSRCDHSENAGKPSLCGWD